MSFAQFVTNQSSDENRKPSLIEFKTDSRFAWQFLLANADFLQQQGENDLALRTLLQACEYAKTDRRRSQTRILLAAAQISLKLFDDALKSIEEAIEMDRAADLGPAIHNAKRLNAQRILEFCDSLLKNDLPISNPLNSVAIDQPALLNGSFELGLTSHWTPFARRNTSLTWNNFGKSNSIAEAVDSESQAGERSLKISIESPIGAESYGQMTQQIP